MKLEEYAQKAKKGSCSMMRSSRTRGGVVTPPTASAFGYLPADSRGLLTYDDEYHSDDGKPSPPGRRVSRDSSTGTLSIDGDERLTIDDDVSSLFGVVVSDAGSPVKPGADRAKFEFPPIRDLDLVKDVLGKILANTHGAQNEHATAFAAVIGFCMTTAPSSGEDLFSKVYHLISSSDTLAHEFQQYRAALHPLVPSSDMLPSFLFTASCRENRIASVKQICEGAANRVDAVREFKTFAVNYFHKVLLQNSSSQSSFTESEVAALRYTADAWLKSSCASS